MEYDFGLLNGIVNLEKLINKPIDTATKTVKKTDSKISKFNSKFNYLADLLSGDKDVFDSTYENLKDKLTSDYSSNEIEKSGRKLTKYERYKKSEKKELMSNIEKLDPKNYKIKLKLLSPNSKIEGITDNQLIMQERIKKFIQKCTKSEINKTEILATFKPMASSDKNLLFNYILIFLIINDKKIGFNLDNLCDLENFKTKNKLTKVNLSSFYDTLKELDSDRLNKFIKLRLKFKQYDFSELTTRLRDIK